jgi:hypothetical protein
MSGPAPSPVQEPADAAADPGATCGIGSGPAGCGGDGAARDRWDPLPTDTPPQTRGPLPGSPKLRRRIAGGLGFVLGAIKLVSAVVAVATGKQPLPGITLDGWDIAGGAVMVVTAVGMWRGRLLSALALPVIFVDLKLRHVPDHDLGTWTMIFVGFTLVMCWGTTAVWRSDSRGGA